MSNVYSLATLRSDLDKEFAPLKIEVEGEELILRNLMRVEDKARNEVLAQLEIVQANAGEDLDEKQEQSPEEIAALSTAVTTILRAVTANGKGEKLVRQIDGDLMLGMKVMEMWTEATQPGEAENSSD